MKNVFAVAPVLILLALPGAAAAQVAEDFECRNVVAREGGLPVIETHDLSRGDDVDLLIRFDPAGVRLFGARASHLRYRHVDVGRGRDESDEETLYASLAGSFDDVVRAARAAHGEPSLCIEGQFRYDCKFRLSGRVEGSSRPVRRELRISRQDAATVRLQCRLWITD